MPKKLKRRVTRPSQSHGQPLLRRLIGAMFQPRALMAVTAAVVIGFGLRFVINQMPDLTIRGEYQISAADIKVTQAPRIVPSDFVEQALRNAELPEQMSLLDDSLSETIHGALDRHPWVKQVHRVTKSPGGKITVDLEYRVPVAMVEVDRGVYPIDFDAVLLPPEDFTVRDAQRYPLISGVLSTPQGPVGTVWGDPIVEHAAKLAETLLPTWEEFQLERINCPIKLDDEAEVFALTTHGKSRILWGAAPGETAPGEPDSGQKIDRMKKYLKRFGNFEVPDGPYEIDIRHWQEISRRPMTAGMPQSVR